MITYHNDKLLHLFDLLLVLNLVSSLSKCWPMLELRKKSVIISQQASKQRHFLSNVVHFIFSNNSYNPTVPLRFLKINSPTTSNSRDIKSRVKLFSRIMSQVEWGWQGFVTLWSGRETVKVWATLYKSEMFIQQKCFNSEYNDSKCYISHSVMDRVTSHSQPTLCWFSNSNDVTLVESFIRLRDIVKCHVSIIASCYLKTIFIENCWKTRGSCLVPATQSQIFSLDHASLSVDTKSRTLQD